MVAVSALHSVSFGRNILSSTIIVIVLQYIERKVFGICDYNYMIKLLLEAPFLPVIAVIIFVIIIIFFKKVYSWHQNGNKL